MQSCVGNIVLGIGLVSALMEFTVLQGIQTFDKCAEYFERLVQINVGSQNQENLHSLLWFRILLKLVFRGNEKAQWQKQNLKWALLAGQVLDRSRGYWRVFQVKTNNVSKASLSRYQETDRVDFNMFYQAKLTVRD